MGDNTTVTVVVAFVVVLLLVAVALLVAGLYVIYRYRLPLRGIAAMVGSFAYLISPIDAAPEAVLGPFGMVDDAGVLTIVAFYVFHLIKARRTNMPMGKAAGIALRDTARSYPRNRPGRDHDSPR
ncbi:YkvA family protein [Kineosporia sp. NBRC 101731]|uniref:YkvA family protein n=1 Tax=Kineosporia sp. NBRC 101731 TaxID=3032199 RepID=UPI0024A1CDC0|nr:YkvA family protein [Kineosporia sp. NBRC 101731]GLY28063.1 hypothetical protein Kisp02_14280 [Kineosporia sp. NBRC 101731]